MSEGMLAKVRWIVQKDLQSEYRSPWAWPRMVLLGVVVACLLVYQMHDVPANVLQRIAPSLCWLTICFAAVLSLGHSIERERQDDCWDGLLLYSVTPETVFLAKLLGNALALGGMQALLMPVFALLCHADWLSHPGELAVVAVLANLGIVSLGTVVGAVSVDRRHGSGPLTIVFLPLLVPVVLAASEATRFSARGYANEQWAFWVQFLGSCAMVYGVLGWLLFAYVVEE